MGDDLGVFLSYRREDSPGHAGRLADALTRRFGAAAIFLDVESIEPGADFVEALTNALERCRVVLAIVGPGWAGRRPVGTTRLRDPDHFVRLAISTALKNGLRVVPVLVNGAVMPVGDQLPPELEAFGRCNAFALPDPTWAHGARVLVDLVASWLLSEGTESTQTGNLPAQRDRLIGRDDEI